MSGDAPRDAFQHGTGVASDVFEGMARTHNTVSREEIGAQEMKGARAGRRAQSASYRKSKELRRAKASVAGDFPNEASTAPASVSPSRAQRGKVAASYVVKYNFQVKLWERWQDHVQSARSRGQRASVPWAMNKYYMGWFIDVSHPRVENQARITVGTEDNDDIYDVTGTTGFGGHHGLEGVAARIRRLGFKGGENGGRVFEAPHGDWFEWSVGYHNI
ncbi:hypothetical protein Scep_012406 [Stephania cephalantha]|uniref:Uncharacterized protein n=1 Tax=Stephania cephalantha TaxID=152367 RepID=A0AAP0P6P2_9MAGN